MAYKAGVYFRGGEVENQAMKIDRNRGENEMNRGRQLQAEYARQLVAAQGRAPRSLTAEEREAFDAGAPLPHLSHIFMDGDSIVVYDSAPR